MPGNWQWGFSSPKVLHEIRSDGRDNWCGRFYICTKISKKKTARWFRNYVRKWTPKRQFTNCKMPNLKSRTITSLFWLRHQYKYWLYSRWCIKHFYYILSPAYSFVFATIPLYWCLILVHKSWSFCFAVGLEKFREEKSWWKRSKGEI